MKFLLLFCSAFLFWQSSTLTTIRKNYPTAHSQELAADTFIQSVVHYSGSDATTQAYQAAAFALQAKYEKKPALKKQIFTQAAQQLDRIIKQNPKLIEARMIRMSIQENTPKVMKYNLNLTEDKAVILASYNQQNREVKEVLKGFVQHSTSFTPSEKRTVL